MAGNAYELTVRRGPDEGRSIPLHEDNLVLGRDPSADIVIADPEVSRQHARFTRTDQGFELQDLGSTNGTFIDGKRLEGDPVELGPGAVITIGNNVTLVYRRTDDAMATVISSEGGLDLPAEEMEGDEEAAEFTPEVSEAPEPEVDPWQEPAFSEDEATSPELPSLQEAAAPSPEDEGVPSFEEDDFDAGGSSDARTILDMEAQGSSFGAQEQSEDDGTDELPSFSEKEPELPSFEEEEAYAPPPPPQPTAGEQGPPPPPPPSVAPSDGDGNRNRNLIIAAIVVLFLLCCCCLLLYVGWVYGDQILFELQQM